MSCLCCPWRIGLCCFCWCCLCHHHFSLCFVHMLSSRLTLLCGLQDMNFVHLLIAMPNIRDLDISVYVLFVLSLENWVVLLLLVLSLSSSLFPLFRAHVV